jgi:hypothetical protein
MALIAAASGGLRNNGNYIVKHFVISFQEGKVMVLRAFYYVICPFPPGNADSSSPQNPPAAAAPLRGKKNKLRQTGHPALPVVLLNLP